LAWEEAESACKADKGHLASIPSRAANELVVSLLEGVPSGPTFWIGATDGKSETDTTGVGSYCWVSGETLGFDNWGAHQPDGHCAACSAVMSFSCHCDHRAVIDSSDGSWSDSWQGTELPFLCESVH